MNKSLIPWVGVVLVTATLVQPCDLVQQGWAGPSSQKPTAALDAIGVIPEAKALIAKANAMAIEAESELAKLFEPNALESRTAAASVLKIRSNLFDASEAARLLQTMDEPAGESLFPYVESMWRPIGTKGQTVGGTRASFKTAQRVLQTLQKGKAKRDKLMQKTVPMVQEGRGDEAYLMLYDEMRDVTVNRSLHHPNATNPVSLEFMQHFYAARDAYIAKKRKDHLQMYADNMKQQAQRVQTFHGKLPQVIEKVLQTDQPEMKPAQVFQGLDAVINAWRTTNVSFVRYEACQQLLARARITDVPQLPISELEHTNQSVAALAQIIQQGGQKVATSETMDLYLGLIERLADLGQRMDIDGSASESSPHPLAPCYAATIQISQRDPSLVRQVQAYNAATGQFLQWKRRLVSQSIDSLEQVTPSSSTLLPSAASPEVSPRSLAFPARPETNALHAESFLKGMTHYQMQDTAARLNNQPVMVSHLQSMPSGPMAVSWILPTSDSGAGGGVSHYAMVTVPEWEEATAQRIRHSLLVSETAPAMTLEASQAIQSMQSTNRVAVGGRISGVTMETGIARLGSMVPAVSVLVPINHPQTATTKALTTGNQKPIESRLLWRLNVTPLWMATPYDVVKL